MGTHADVSCCTTKYVASIEERLRSHLKNFEAFIPISCLQKNTITALKDTIAKAALDSGLVGGRIPTNFQKIQVALNGVRATTPLISFTEFKALLAKVKQLSFLND